MYRLIEAVIPKNKKEDIEKLCQNSNVLDYWREEVYEDKTIYKILVKTEFSQELIDKLSRKFSKDERFRIILLDIVATVPAAEEKSKKIGRLRISREELYSKVLNFSQINYVYITMVVISTIIAAFGFITQNVAVIIGAMVIAPLLGPNIAISFATVIGDLELEKKSFITFGAGVVISFVLALIIGLFLHVSPDNAQIHQRIYLNISEIIIAVASGAAGVLAFTTGASESLVGVMVAISLLPPVVSSALLLGSGFVFLSVKSFLLFLENFVSLNLAGVAVFIFQGVKPRNWWEEKKAKEHRKKSIFLWGGLLLILILIIYIDKYYFG